MSKGQPGETPEQRKRRSCWNCKAGLGSPNRLKPGDYALCQNCGSINIVREALALQENGEGMAVRATVNRYATPTQEELEFSPRDEAKWQWLRKCRLQFKEWLKNTAETVKPPKRKR